MHLSRQSTAVKCESQGSSPVFCKTELSIMEICTIFLVASMSLVASNPIPGSALFGLHGHPLFGPSFGGHSIPLHGPPGHLALPYGPPIGYDIQAPVNGLLYGHGHGKTLHSPILPPPIPLHHATAAYGHPPVADQGHVVVLGQKTLVEGPTHLREYHTHSYVNNPTHSVEHFDHHGQKKNTILHEHHHHEKVIHQHHEHQHILHQHHTHKVHHHNLHVETENVHNHHNHKVHVHQPIYHTHHAKDVKVTEEHQHKETHGEIHKHLNKFDEKHVEAPAVHIVDSPPPMKVPVASHLPVYGH